MGLKTKVAHETKIADSILLIWFMSSNECATGIFVSRIPLVIAQVMIDILSNNSL